MFYADGLLQIAGYALLSEVSDMDLGFRSTSVADFPDTEVSHSVVYCL
jgi:hypothetical protein